MRDRDARAREIMAAIRTLLLQQWDPVGVKHVAGAQDEYDAYIGGIYRVLASEATEQQVAEHLHQLEAQQMGLTAASAADLLPIARELRALDVRLDDGPAGTKD